MAKKYPLKPSAAEEHRTFEVFQPKFSADDLSAIAKNPSEYFRGLLESWGIPVNGLFIDDRIVKGQALALSDTTTIWHCKAPPARMSETMIITTPAM